MRYVVVRDTVLLDVKRLYIKVNVNLNSEQASSARAQLRDAFARTDACLTEALPRLRPLAAVTPANAVEERMRLGRCLAQGKPLRPAWRYPPASPLALRATKRLLADAAAALPTEDGFEGRLRAAYEARIAELYLTLACAASVGTAAHREHSRRLFGAPNAAEITAAKRDIAGLQEALPIAVILEPNEIADIVAKAIAQRGLPFRLQWAPHLASRAAVGDGVLFLRPEPIRRPLLLRLIVHELDGHARSETRSKLLPVALGKLGAAGSAMDQEGIALWREADAGHYDARRRGEIAARVLAVTALDEGQSFAGCVRCLSRFGVSDGQALACAERVYRGGGFYRDTVYSRGLGRIAHHLRVHPQDLDALQTGKLTPATVFLAQAFPPA